MTGSVHAAVARTCLLPGALYQTAIPTEQQRSDPFETFVMGTESESMLQLAAEAFQSKNFDLAADIYQCQLGGLGSPGGRLVLMVKRADALAYGGKLAEAFSVYRQASEIERLRPAHLDNLLDYLKNNVRRREGEETGRPGDGGGGGGGGGSEAFSCGMCLGFLAEPVTLPCGHCFCAKCLERERREPEKAPSCKQCGAVSKLTDVPGYRVNVVLSNLLVKWFPGRSRAVRLRREGNELYAERKMEAALEKYNQAILIAPRDHILFSNRSQINSSLKHYEKALEDADSACRLMPHWPKGHVRKAQALVSLGRTDEALREYLVCLSIEPDSRLARMEAHKLLGDLLAPVTDQVPIKVLDYSSLLTSRAHVKNSIMQTTSHILHTSAMPIPSHATSQSATATSKPSRSLSGPQTVCQGPMFLESKLPSSNPALLCPQLPGESSENREVKGQGETESRKLDFGFVHKRKRRSSEKEAEEEQRDDRKRRKCDSIEHSGSWSPVVGDLSDPTDLECSLCMRLFHEPVTTPCGHTFCLQCLERCLDHNPKCPLCKQELSEYLAHRQYCKTVLMEYLISKYFPNELMERQKMNQEEMAELSNLNKNVPMFVCTMAFPTVPCPLHIFEPCYRLMIRRCMETGTKCFGMCLGDNHKGFADFGCLLEIRNVEFFSDGRSVVDTIGRRRFKVIQHSQRDGYNTADIEYLEDVKVEGVEEHELQSLHDTVYDQALLWVNSLKPEQKERIMGHFGPMPEKDSEPQNCPSTPDMMK
ncbi:LON peptidase N-terminal domain and RING finger protein 3-like isoform X2 [Lampris incognitus]|uniref:LON peptidase N-terminal domain and RING finger protein 3-like isoform X2 n=1 Tax=Lampris incognitus TaxID=2546036 RepID=UPI0024B5BD3F|nr:LON peptidase N-terminal domain and RING finger protein 3-like isoform X2 [Lampris incognitus]